MKANISLYLLANSIMSYLFDIKTYYSPNQDETDTFLDYNSNSQLLYCDVLD